MDEQMKLFEDDIEGWIIKEFRSKTAVEKFLKELADKTSGCEGKKGCMVLNFLPPQSLIDDISNAYPHYIKRESLVIVVKQLNGIHKSGIRNALNLETANIILKFGSPNAGLKITDLNDAIQLADEPVAPQDFAVVIPGIEQMDNFFPTMERAIHYLIKENALGSEIEPEDGSEYGDPGKDVF